MMFRARVDNKWKAKCKGLSVKHHNIKIGKVLGSHIDKGQVYVDIKIDKKPVQDEIRALLYQPNLLSVTLKDDEEIMIKCLKQKRRRSKTRR